MMIKTILIIFCFFKTGLSYGLTELSVEGSYSKKVFGTSRQNDQISKAVTSSVAFYLFSNTAIELNYTDSDEETNVRTSVDTSEESVTFKGYKTTLNNVVYGVGIRQALAGRKARFRPLLSIGYAKRKIRDQTEYQYKLDSTGQTIRLKSPINRVEDDSVFGSFSLQIRLTQATSLSASIRTVFPAFEFSEAEDYLKYTVGLTWLL